MKNRRVQFISIALVLLFCIYTAHAHAAVPPRVTMVADQRVVRLQDIRAIRSAKQADRILVQVERCDPDLIAVTGDLVDAGYYSRMFGTDKAQQTLGLLARLTAVAPVCYVCGERERAVLGDRVHTAFLSQTEALGVTILQA